MENTLLSSRTDSGSRASILTKAVRLAEQKAAELGARRKQVAKLSRGNPARYRFEIDVIRVNESSAVVRRQIKKAGEARQ